MPKSYVDYAELTGRNLGILSEQEQAVLHGAKVCIAGLGGLGGVVLEVLARSGIRRFSLMDKDRLEASNMNRQILAKPGTLGRRKIDVAVDLVREFHPDGEVQTWLLATDESAGPALADCDALVMAMDDFRPCLVLADHARRAGIPAVEGWGLPYANVRTITDLTPSLAETYGFPLNGRSVSEVSDDELDEWKQAYYQQLLGSVDGLTDHLQADALRRAAAGKCPSFAPMVWLTAVLMAFETIKVILGHLRPADAPALQLFDPFTFRTLTGR